MSELRDSKRRLVEALKRVDSATAGELALEFGLTDTAVRQHLEALQTQGLVQRVDVDVDAAPTRRGRPATRWSLTTEGHAVFPDRHADLTVELIDAIRSGLGDDALARVIESRAARQLDHYRRSTGQTPLAVRVRRLADERTAEGYEAEVLTEGDAFVLVEHHCPIAAAARSCGALCAAELDVFARTLGDGVRVRREQHLLQGDARCAYRITAA